jgi:hypothetical protein
MKIATVFPRKNPQLSTIQMIYKMSKIQDTIVKKVQANQKILCEF